MKLLSPHTVWMVCAGLVTANVLAQDSVVPAPNRTDMVHDFDTDLMYIADGHSVVRYHVGSGAMIDPIALAGPLRGIDLSRDGRTLAVATAAVSATENWVYLIDVTTGAIQQVKFTRAFGETGTFTVAWAADNSLFISSSYGGSGSVPLRRYDPATQTTSTVQTRVQQDTMLQFSSNGMWLGWAGTNNSSGPFGTYRLATGLWSAGAAGWFTWEVGVNRDGTQLAVPTYSGMFVYDAAFKKLATIGTYAGAMPIAVAYHPVEPLMYLPFAQTSQVRIYNTATFTQVGAVDAGAPFPWVGNWAFKSGRIKLAQDASLLIVTVDGGVRVVRLHAPLQAFDSQVLLNEDVPTSVTFQASIGNNGPLQYDIVTPPQHGQLTGTGATRTYLPAQNYHGADSITFSVRYGEAIRHRTVSLTVRPQNDAPMAVNDTATTKRNTPITVPVLGNDYDVDGDTLSIAAVSAPTSGVAKIVGNAITYTPAKAFTGQASFSYTVQDGKGGTASATVVVVVSK